MLLALRKFLKPASSMCAELVNSSLNHLPQKRSCQLPVETASSQRSKCSSVLTKSQSFGKTRRQLVISPAFELCLFPCVSIFWGGSESTLAVEGVVCSQFASRPQPALMRDRTKRIPCKGANEVTYRKQASEACS
eukprot:3752268-Amphidinium_carterae.2